MNRIAIGFVIASVCLFLGCARPPAHLVEDGEARAVIVVRENPPRLLGLAALELQYYLEQMSGARLPIVHEPRAEGVNLFVGRSRFTDELGISDEGLPHGAYRMASGPDWLALVGHDRDFLPPEPFRRDLNRAESLEVWDAMIAEVTNSKWSGPPVSGGGLWNQRSAFRAVMAERYGEEHVDLLMTERTPGWPGDGFSRWDLGGSLNAVYRYLMSLGVRWYMPGELGEVVPEKRTVSFASEMNRTVHPDYALRVVNWSAYHTQPLENIMWAKRVGLNASYEIWPFTWSHQLTRVYRRPEMKEMHPEMFALRGGVRDTDHRGVGSACFSSERLVRETVDYARFVFDRFDMPTVDLWPEDGFRGCQCELCEGKSPSEMVFEFVDRVARELYTTHPDRWVTCGAYTPYKDPPATIDRFTPNVGIMLSNLGRTRFDRPEHLATFMDYVEAWQEKLEPGQLLRWENNFHNSREEMQFPVIHARAIATELEALRGISMGEFHNWQRRPQVFHNPGSSHLTLYTLAQYLWDAGQDIDAFLEEYYTLFYGPAREEMKFALEYAQAQYLREARGPAAVSRAVQAEFVSRLHAARARAGDTVYGGRIQVIIDELPELDELRRLAREEAEAADPRANAPLIVGREGREPDPTYWRIVRMGGADVYGMRDIVSGEYPAINTTFQVWWEDDAVHFEIRCEEPDMRNLVSTDRVVDGDSVVLLIETQEFSYYHIQISPDGRLVEQAINPAPGMGAWTAQADVETERGADHWTVRVRLPVTGAGGLAMDPNHRLAGSQPDRRQPWHINVGRTRVRNGVVQQFAYSPLGHESMHDPDRFALFIFGRP